MVRYVESILVGQGWETVANLDKKIKLNFDTQDAISFPLNFVSKELEFYFFLIFLFFLNTHTELKTEKTHET